MRNHYALFVYPDSFNGVKIAINRFCFDKERQNWLFKEVSFKYVCGGCINRLFGHRYTKKDVEHMIRCEKSQIERHQRELERWEDRLKTTDWSKVVCTEDCVSLGKNN